MSGIYQADLRHISGIYLAYLRHIPDIYLAYFQQISGKSLGYLRNYLRNIKNVSQANLRYISRGNRLIGGIYSIYQANHSYISVIPHGYIKHTTAISKYQNIKSQNISNMSSSASMYDPRTCFS